MTEHNDAVALLNRTYASVQTSDLPEALHEVAFTVLLASALGGTGRAGEPTVTPPRREAGMGAGQPDEAAASRLHVPVELVQEAFSFDGGSVEVLVPASSIAASAAAGTRQLALLGAAARQGADLEEQTPVDVIRAVCEEYKRYDSKNSMTVLSGIDEIKIEGKGVERSVRMLRPAWERASEVLKAVMGAG